MKRVVVVGGGVIGTAVSVGAVDRGHEVVQLEREAEPRGASVRNFGLIWICGRGGGRELELALAGRARWQALAARAPAIGFRPVGCLVAARNRGEGEARKKRSRERHLFNCSGIEGRRAFSLRTHGELTRLYA